MTHTVKIGCISLNQTPLDWANNYNNIKNALDEAKSKDIEIVCLPELCLTGYNCEDMFLADWVIEKAENLLVDLCKLSEGITIIVGLPFKHNNNLYNCAAVLNDQRCRGIVPKRFLANQEIYYEPRWFLPWNGKDTIVKVNHIDVPFGKIKFRHRESIFGIEICEDAWSEHRPGLELINEGANIIFNLSASHFSIGKMQRRLRLGQDLQSASKDIVYAYANLLGNESGRSIYDGSSYILDTNSTLISNRFSFKDFELISKDVETKSISRKINQDYLQVDLKAEDINKFRNDKNISSKIFKEDELDLHYFEFTYAVSLGIYDYLRKSGNKRIVISLSGGADSAACAILSHLGFKIALQERGLAQVAKDLNISETELPNWDFLYCIYQKTKNNSMQTESTAKTIAENLGATFYSTSIDENVSLYTEKVESMFKIKLDWKNHDVVLQNIQARTRGPLVWMIANFKNALLISTSNRSEAAVGYTTMDGDTCGGVSPIGGIDKSFILGWLKWLEKSTALPIADFKFLNVLNSLPPSAELKPLNQEQTDEKELMPYEVLNTIEKLFVRDKLSLDKILSKTSEFHPNFSSTEIESWVNKFLTLWRINQWKRERYAPSFHLDDESLDPKSWFRYPILSGKLTKS